QQLGNSRIRPAQRAVRVTPDADFAEPHGERVVHQQASDQGLPLADDEFNRFGRLDHTNNPGQNSQDTGFTSRRHHTRRGWCEEQAAVARAGMWREDTRLTFKLKNTAVHHRLVSEESSIVYQVARGEVVAAIHDNVIVPKDVHDVVYRQTFIVDAHLDIGIETINRLLGRLGLGYANAVGAVQDLALQVREVHNVGIDNAQRA